MTSRQRPTPDVSATPVAVFDLDGTLLDSDAPLLDAFVRLGVPAESVTWGHVVSDECDRLGVSLRNYLDAYDLTAAQPYAGAAELVASLDRWAVVSNKHPDLGRPELARLGWNPEVVMFADMFQGPKQLGPTLEAMGLAATDVLFVGDTSHDRACARAVGASFAWAGWNPRAAALARDRGVANDPHHSIDPVLNHPGQVIEVLASMATGRWSSQPEAGSG